jgi:SAM-dependent methyltransferase
MAGPDDGDALLAEQMAYYRARAPEYDQWWLREGVYDHGEEFNRQWRYEIEELRATVESFAPRGDVLELASGTGGWTTELARHASSITAVDASAEALAICKRKLARSATPVHYVEADLFDWVPDRRYDLVFFSFWLSHVPRSHLAAFWRLVERALAPGGRFFFIDNAPPSDDLVEELTQRFPDLRVEEDGAGRTPWSTGERDAAVSIRRVSDGREFQIVKVFWPLSDLEEVLRPLELTLRVNRTELFFVYGQGSRTNRPQGRGALAPRAR